MKNHQLTINRKMSNNDFDRRVATDDIHLYWASGSIASWRVQIALSEKQIHDYQHRIILLDQHEHKIRPIIDQNHRGQVPSLRIGNLILNESLSICLHLEVTLKNQGTVLLPDDPHLQAQVLQCVFDSLRVQKFAAEDVIYYIWHRPLEQRENELLIDRKKKLIQELIRWENRLKQRNESPVYAVGKEFTLADIFLFPQFALLVHCAYPIDRHQSIDSYYKHLCDRPSIRQTFPPHWSRHQSNILMDCAELISTTE